MVPESDKKTSWQGRSCPRQRNRRAATIRMLAWFTLAIPGMLGLFSGPNSGPAQTIFASLFVVVALAPMLALLAIQNYHSRGPDVDLPGVQPPSLWGPVFYVPIMILAAYVLITHVSLSYSHPMWFRVAERLTRPVADFLPGVTRTTRQLRVVGLAERAQETGHYLALAWILTGTSVVVGSLTQWFTWTDANYLRIAASVRRGWARLTPGRRVFAGFGLGLMSCLTIASPFLGGMRGTVRFPYDLSGDEIQFFVGLWYNCLFPFAFFGSITVIGLYLNAWRHAQSLPGSNGEA